MTRYRQTIVYGCPGGREYVQVWLWHPARIVALRLWQELTTSSRRPIRTVLEREGYGTIYDSAWWSR